MHSHFRWTCIACLSQRHRLLHWTRDWADLYSTAYKPSAPTSWHTLQRCIETSMVSSTWKISEQLWCRRYYNWRFCYSILQSFQRSTREARTRCWSFHSLWNISIEKYSSRPRICDLSVLQIEQRKWRRAQFVQDNSENIRLDFKCWFCAISG